MTVAQLDARVLDMDGDKVVSDICGRMREILSRDLSRRGFVIAMSGGIDSSVCAALAVKAIDTTAAGDCFVGVLAASLDRGLDLPAAMKRASAAAALACTKRGSQGSLPEAAETDAAVGA